MDFKKKYLKYKKKYLSQIAGNPGYSSILVPSTDKFKKKTFDFDSCVKLSDLNLKYLKKIGSGFFGTTHLVENEEKKQMVLKISNESKLDPEILAGFSNEVIKLIEINKFKIKGVPRYYQCVKTDDKIGLLMEYIEGISALNFFNLEVIKKLSKDKLKYLLDLFFYKLFNLIKKIHQHKIYHKDIHLGNIMIQLNSITEYNEENIEEFFKENNLIISRNFKIYLVDFGTSCIGEYILSDFYCSKSFTPYTKINNYTDIYRSENLENQNQLSDFMSIVNLFNLYSIFNVPIPNLFKIFFEQSRYFFNDMFINFDILNNLLENFNKKFILNPFREIKILESMSLADLFDIGSNLGISFPVGKSRDEIIKIISDYDILIPLELKSISIDNLDESLIGNCVVSLKPSNKFFEKLKIISVSLFILKNKDNKLKNKYINGLNKIVLNFKKIYPDFILRIYYDDSLLLDKNFMEIFREYKTKDFIQFARYQCNLSKEYQHPNLMGAFTRFLALGDRDLDLIVFRDIDYNPHQHDMDNINQFINLPEMVLHSLSFEPYEYSNFHSRKMNIIEPFILAGLFAVKNQAFLENGINLMNEIFYQIKNKYTDLLLDTTKPYETIKEFNYGFDEVILNRVFYQNTVISDFIRNKICRVFIKRFFNTNIMKFFLNEYSNFNSINSNIPEEIALILKEYDNKLFTFENGKINYSIVSKIFISDEKMDFHRIDIFYQFLDKIYNNGLINVAWFEILLPYN